LICQVLIFLKIKENKITKKELEILKESLMKNEDLKEINLESKLLNKMKGNSIQDEGCIILNEIFKESKLERINLGSKQNLMKKVME
jgi:hypothetical protein